jgi:7,8-dihydropterin-6-yl-methyl-4-(beta-D-ribofuranosyl)aminobenzene 5'-phosphate synthase
MPPISLSILFDNYPFHPQLTALWGFAALIRLPQQNILFDTGSNGRVLLKNMKALDIDPSTLDLLFLSHPHWDHMGGLDSLLEVKPELHLVLHEGFSKHLIHDLRGQCATLTVVGATPQSIAPGVSSTGLLNSEPPEHALLIETDELTLLISGCAHPGIATIVEGASRMLQRKVDAVIGGFHLMAADADRIAHTIERLQTLGVTKVLPTHCSGDQAIAALHTAYGEDCFEGGVGRQIDFGAAP